MTKPPWTMRSDFSEAPIFVCWETTKACLLACKHCRAKAIRRPMHGELDREQGMQLIDQLTRFGEPYPALLLTGGDPLMRNDFFDLIERAKSHGIYVAVAASVTPKLNASAMSRMTELGVDIMSVSLDGASSATHDKLRGIRGTWNETIQSLHVAKRLGLRAQINTTVMRSNLEELADVFHIVRETGAVAWEVFFLIRTGRGAALEALEPAECEGVMHFLFDAAHYGVPVRTAEGPNFRRVRIERRNNKPPPNIEPYLSLTARLRLLEGQPTSEAVLKLAQTRDGKGIIFVAHDGEVYPSGFLPVSSGKLPEDDLGRVYRSSPLFTALRDSSNLKGRCGKCEYKEICGGSRSRAFAEYGDPFQEDPACPYVPNGNLSEPITLGNTNLS
jgi:radical SAM protein